MKENIHTETGVVKKPTSFNLDPDTFKMFKSDCAKAGRAMSTVIEELMRVFHKDITDS